MKTISLLVLAVAVAANAAAPYDEPSRPQLRFSQRTGWINDPNGLSYRNGEWHFFFQHNPTATKWGNLHWGHAVSKDLVHWTELPDAIGPEGQTLMFSGSGVTDKDGVAGFGKGAHLLFYTAACMHLPGKPFTQCVAYSLDGRSYTKYAGNPVVPNIAPEDRDPFVFWHEPTKAWVMVLYVQGEKRHTFRIFNSTDLLHWTQTQTLEGDEKGKGRWRYECPGLVKLFNESGGPSRWVLWGGGPYYDIGDFDGRTFTAHETKLMAYLSSKGGQDTPYYAGQVFNDAPDGRTIKVEWFRAHLGQDGFTECFSLPQELSLRRTPDGPRLVRRPLRELESLRDGPAVPIGKFKGELAELHLSCRPAPDAQIEFDLRGVKLRYDRRAGGTLSSCGRTVAWPLENGRLALRVYLDRVGMEVFARDGLSTFPVPEARPDRTRTDIKCDISGTVDEVDFRAFRLHSIHRRPATFHVDSAAGDDTADGLTPQTAWRTLERVDMAATRPGDKILFRRGGLWRGGFRPKSGTPENPVLYGAYGEGPKPILQRSLDRSAPSFWQEIAPGIWATAMATNAPGRVWMDLSQGEDAWRCGFPREAKGWMRWTTEDGRRFMRFHADGTTAHASNIQLWGPETPELPDVVLLEMELRANIPFSLPDINFMTYSGAPWLTPYQGNFGARTISNRWTKVSVAMPRSYRTPRPTYLHWSIGGYLRKGMTLDMRPIAVRELTMPAHALPSDVGIVILDHGRKWGVKKWRADDLKEELDYWYDPHAHRVLLKTGRNPGEAFASVELALTQHVIMEADRHDIVYDGLAVRYTGAHGWCGGNTRNITIRNCEAYWIGGGLQYWKKRPDGTTYPVRYGNAVEFWGHAVSNLVERNRFWQIYDAATTSQSNGDSRPELDITWRDNVIWQAEYSFEYWNHDPTSFTGNILFEHNTCVDAGYCWSHGQRPNPNGAHLMFFENPCAVTNFVVRNNIFCRGVDRSTRMWNDWRAKNPDAKDGLVMENNLYWFPSGKIFELNPLREFLQKGEKPMAFMSGPEEFRRYQQETGMDKGSVFGEPQFVDEANRDYRLKPGSFGTNLATDGGPMGARFQ